MRSVSVIGIGETKFGKFIDRPINDMIKEAGEAAISDAGINKSDIQAVYFGNFNGQMLCKQGHMGPLVTEVLGLGTIPSVRTEGACASGSLAFRQAAIAIMCGIYDIVLVGGAEKMCHQDTETVTEALTTAMDFHSEVELGLTFPGIFAQMANRYFHEYRDVKKAMAMCAVNAHSNAMLNPDAQMQKPITVDKVLSAGMICDPLSLYDCSLVTDGSAFVVLATTEIAEKLNKHRIVELVGSGHAGDAVTLYNKQSLTTLAATVNAAKEAYTMAGLTPKDIDFAEVHDCFTITQILNIEDLGFFEKGHGGDAVEEGKIARDGIIPINVSGGLKAKGHPIGATGISQVYEVVSQLRGNAGERQLKKTDIGLTHNLGGSAGTCVINIFKGR